MSQNEILAELQDDLADIDDMPVDQQLEALNAAHAKLARALSSDDEA